MFKELQKLIMAVDDDKKEVVHSTNVMSIGDMYPIFEVSSVDKRGLKTFIEFLNILPSNKQWLENKKDASEFLITQMHQLGVKKNKLLMAAAQQFGKSSQKRKPSAIEQEHENEDNQFILCGIVSKGLIFPR